MLIQIYGAIYRHYGHNELTIQNVKYPPNSYQYLFMSYLEKT